MKYPSSLARMQAVYLWPQLLLQLLAMAQTCTASSNDDGSSARQLDIVYAVNCGGEEHVDSLGVPYQRDPSLDGQASDYGLRWQVINSATQDDFILYQTERFAESTFGYDIPIPKNSKPTNYVLVLKFAEVYFNQAGMKVFDVLLNGDHLVIDGLDIFERAGGRAAAFDVHIPFKVTGNKLVLLSTGEESDLPTSRVLRLDFVKTSQDNPKCNAFYLARASLTDIPKFEVKSKAPETLDEEYPSDPKSEHSSQYLDEWNSPSEFFDFPTPASVEETESGLEKYYPVIAVFLFIGVLTFFLFKL
ncbi:putative Malectin [Hypsibius exemplaris]|uniref:Malectin n=1 Tax=Hypsibius exemplaris TaxID=2072580 RepID=A0A1W0XF03_HYPEX|nr:putative Malectin [Hypsibius exemplaris]